MDVPNALGFQRVIETETNGYLVRQYLYSSLYDRMSTRPFLEDTEKKWLAFQLLCALRDSHARGIFHGDIKTENTLVTSWNWLYLSDFSSSFKPATLPEDNPADFSYFFDTAGRRTCYLAPERFLAAGEEPDSKAEVTWAMDVFSAGCVIAELFLESPIFNLSQLYKYKKGEYNPSISQLNRIADKEIRDMVCHMIQVEPEKRYSAEEYLNFWRKKVFPDYFYSFLHQYMALVTDPSSGRSPISGSSINLGEVDERIDRIYYDFDKISYFLGYENEKLASEKSLISKPGLSLFPVYLSIPNHEHQASTTKRSPADDGALIFLTVIVSSIRHTARATSRVRACDLLLNFAERLTDEAKLDRILPYLVALLNDKADIVKVAAIRTIAQLMALVTVISPVNAHVFPEYILPRMQYFLAEPGASLSPFVRATYAACLGSLATTASRFLDMVATLRADGSLPTADPETEDGGNERVAFHGLYDNSREELVEVFESHTKALITDTDSSVRQAFLGSVPELCLFFGTTESNDVILSHLNTYLNGRDWVLKCAFFETIVGVATFLGGISVEEFILPLMVQALADPEEFVIEGVIRSLASMAELGLFQRSKTWELVDLVGRFTMHPNIWIREATAMFISASTIYLSDADNHCIILPLLRPYLKSSIENFSELGLLDTLKKPLSRSVLDLALTWATKSDKGIFWKPVHQLRAFSFGSASHTIPTLSAKDLAPNSLSKVSKNDEDDQWIGKLRNMGMTTDDEFKLLAMREYIWRMAPLKLREPASQHPAYLNSVIHLRNFGITPQTVMFDDQQAADQTLRDTKHVSPSGERTPQTIANALLDASMSIDDSASRRRKSAFNSQITRLNGQRASLSNPNETESQYPSSLARSPAISLTQGSSPIALDPGPRLLSSLQSREASQNKLSDDESSSITDAPSSLKGRNHKIRHKSSAISLLNREETSKSHPETGTTPTNAFGRVEGPFTHTAHAPSILALAEEREDPFRAEFRYKAAHTYSGNDPSILKLLDSMYVENYPNDVVEFGPLVAPVSRRKAINRSSVQAADKPWKPEGILVATFSEHVGPVNRVVVAPDHAFFITGGDDGTVKVWDSARLERNITHRSRQTHKHTTGAKISSLCFVENTHCFISCASDGSVNVVKVDYVFSGGVTVGRYGKLRTLREYKFPEGEFAVWSDHFRLETSSVLILATNTSRLVAIDLRTMKILYTLENPVHHGTPTCFITDRKRNWLLLGTSHGVLDLWDLRFRVRLKAWGIPGVGSIYKLCMHPFKGRGRWVCVAAGSGEITVWDIEKTQCREVYRTAGNREGPKVYDPWPVDEDKPEGMLGRFATALEPSSTGNTDRGIRATVAGTDAHDDGRDLKYGFLVTGGCDRKIRFWDLAHFENSAVISGLAVDEPKPTFVSSHPTVSLTLNTERIPRSGPPTAPNAAAGSSKASTSSKKSSSSGDKPPRTTVISQQQKLLLRSHLDSILDIALLENPYGMTVSVDRSGCIYIFQ